MSKASKTLELERTVTKIRPWVWPVGDNFNRILLVEKKKQKQLRVVWIMKYTGEEQKLLT